jgi:beta-galactosidase
MNDRETQALGVRQVSRLTDGWRFSKGDIPGAADPAFDDTPWQTVQVPHDWAIAGPFHPEENGYAGKLPWKGVGWYRRHFQMDERDRHKKVYLDFDGVMAFPQVYINGQLAGSWDYGYVSFRVDATDVVKFGEGNVLAVRVDTRPQGTRWYPGAGIYRKVTMTLAHPVHLAHWGTFVTTPEVSADAAIIQIQSKVENHAVDPARIRAEVTLADPDGRPVATLANDTGNPVAAGEHWAFTSRFTIAHPRRWDIDRPQCYTVRTVVKVDGQAVDTESIPFGIRSFAFTAHDGFHLNGRRRQLYGVNLHHDHGPLGAAFYTRAMERQLEIMRDMGCNAIRTSHNPPAPELLDLCDRMGFVVWNEAFDKWDDKAGRQRGKPPLEDYGHRQIRNFVLRDRNHPSVVVWSIGNEIGNQPYDREGKSPERVKFMRDFFLQYDPTRPVGIGCHIPGTADEPILDSMDLTGWNYARRYARYRERYPDKPILYSESASTLSTRGYYNPELPDEKTRYTEDLQVCSYDLNAAAWSDIPDAEFKLMQDDSFVAGEFVWTGFDYLGEPTPFTQEARSSYFGIVDLCGIPKDRFYLYRSHWRPDTPTIHILPHWNWPERIGRPVPVFVYTNGDAAELFLNGKSLGRREKGTLPARPSNLAWGRPARAGSHQVEFGHEADHATDGDSETRWCAADGSSGAWWRVDLQAVQTVGFLMIELEKEVKLYGYTVETSRDGSDWQTVATKPTSRRPQWGGPRRAFHEVAAQARYIRITFNEMRQGVWPSIREFGVFSEKTESDYYDPTYTYRLRWNEVRYEPGELKALAYKNGRVIGQAVQRTAGKPRQLRLTPDRNRLDATGLDLCYIRVEALDSHGTLCPLAENRVSFQIDGPADIAGVGNGNPLSLEPFQARERQLFYGKAMLILRTRAGSSGDVVVTATGEGLSPATAQIKVK